ncbi:MAG: hypothetical protein JJE47_12770 [Acidimicrobiia bacterium]|nr:hypothetical protein [Acidimicrobiia bacterium]
MDTQEPLSETVDDTQLDLPADDLSDPSSIPGSEIEADASIELAIEVLAGMDAAEAPELADQVAARLRAQLSDR